MSTAQTINPIQLMTLPFLECLVLVGIHSYLGLHVIRRQVIFVDLSLAQIAALGTTVGFLFGIHPHTAGAFFFSVSFTFLGAALFALTRTRSDRVPQEAVIGLVYALAAAMVILVIDRAPHGAEHIKEMLTGSILWVKGKEVAEAAVVYLLVGVFHYFARDKFLLITNDPEEARKQNINIPLWDFLFYMSFGLVITYSVNTAGVLLVFVFLVVPAVIAVSITDRLLWQLVIGWGLGTLVSVLGLAMSYWFDMPSGPAVVTFYGLVLLVVALFLYFWRAESRWRAFLKIGLGAAAVVLIVGYFWGLKAIIKTRPAWYLGEHYSVSKARSHADRHRSKTDDFDDLDVVDKGKAVKKLSKLSTLKQLFEKVHTIDGKLEVAKRTVQIDKVEGARMLLVILSSKAPPFFQSEALDEMGRICNKKYTFDPMNDDPSALAPIVEEARRCVEGLKKTP